MSGVVLPRWWMSATFQTTNPPGFHHAGTLRGHKSEFAEIPRVVPAIALVGHERIRLVILGGHIRRRGEDEVDGPVALGRRELVEELSQLACVAFDDPCRPGHPMLHEPHTLRQQLDADRPSVKCHRTLQRRTKPRERIEDKISRCTASFDHVVDDRCDHVHILISTERTFRQEGVVRGAKLLIQR